MKNKRLKKALSVFLSILMLMSCWVWVAPTDASAANKYYVKVYVNIYDGSDGYGGAYTVEESTGKPKNYSWATNDGWYGRINMTGFTVFGEKAGDYSAQDVSDELKKAEDDGDYYAMSNLSNDNASGDWDSKAVASFTRTFELESFPVEVFWMNDENNWDGGNTGFAIRKLTVATSENGVEHTMWEGLAGSDSQTYNYYGSITPTGIHTCFEDYAKNYDMDDYKFYKAITSSSQRAWTDPYTYGSAGTYYLNEYANGGVSATFSEGATSVASTVDYIDTSSTDTYYVNYTNHSKTQIAEITGTYNDGNFVSSPYGIKLNPGETRSFEINKSNYSKLAKYNNAANFTFEYTLSNVYASDEINPSLAKFTQPTYIGLWNESSYSKSGTTFSLNNIRNLQVTFQTTEGILETVSTPSGKVDHASVEYRYYIDNSVVNNSWEKTGLRFYMTETNNSRVHFQNKNKTAGTMRFSGPIINTSNASLKMADFAFSSVTENFVYNVSATATYDKTVTPTWEPKTSDSFATFWNNNPAWVRFGGTTFEINPDAENQYATILLSDMLFNDYSDYQAKFSASIDVYAVNKAELRNYVRETLLDFAPMSLRYNTTAFENYQNKLASAMNVLADQKTTQKAVTNALAELKSAVEALQTTDNLINQVAELSHIQFVGGIGSEVATKIAERYVLIPLGGHTVPQNTAYIGNGTYKDKTNKKSNLATNYAKTDTAIETLKYYYWNIEFAEYDENRSVVDFTIDNLETAIAGFDSNIYSNDYYKALVEAKKALEAIDQNDGTNSPSTQEEVETAIINADNLLAHLGNNMRVHQWIEDNQGNYVAESDKYTHWYTCSICGYELVYNHYFEYEKIDDAQHKATCVTSGTDEGCGYSFTEDHIWVEGETVATSCTEANVNYSCVCGATKTEAITTTGHNFVITDNGDGTHISKCSKCDANEEGAVAEAHTLSYVNNNDGTHTATCDICDYEETVDHIFTNPELARPTLVDGVWKNGTYTYTCTCGATKTEPAVRANYTAYDEAVAGLNALLNDTTLTGAAITEINNVLADNKIADNLVTAEQDTVDNAAAALKVVLDKINGNKDAYQTPDSSAAKKAVEDAEALADKIEMPQSDKDKINELRTELNDILDDMANDDNATAEEYQSRLEAVEEAAKVILEKYKDCTDGHVWNDGTLTQRPAFVDGKWADGYYTYTCDNCGTTKTEPAVRANYTAYDEAVAGLNALLNDTTLTDAAIAEINKVLADNKIADNLVTAEQDTVDNAAAALKVVLDKIANDTTGAYEKVNFTEYNAAVNAYESLKDNMSEADKNAVAEAMKSVTDANIDGNTSKADGQDILDEATAKIVEINAKYGNCAAGNHTWGEPVLTKKPTATEQGEYTETCGICGAKQITKVDLANYGDFNTVVGQLQNLANTENLTAEAAKAITDALAKAEALDKNLPADATTADGKVIKGGQDKIDALVAELNGIVVEVNGAIADGSALRPDYVNWEIAEGNYDALDKTNVKADIIAEANGLKDTIAGKQADKTLTQATATQDDIDDATTRLNQIIAGINDGSLKNPDYSAVENKITEAKGNDNLNKDTQDKIKDIEEELQKIKDKTKPEANAKDDQPAVDALEDQLDEILDSIANGTATAPDYTNWDADEGTYDALDKTNISETLINEATGLKNTINTLKADPTANAKDDQATIDNATTRLNEIITEINGILNEKPNFNGYDDAHDEYEDLVAQYGDKIKDSVAEDVADLDEIVDGVRTDETATKIEDQGTVDNAKTQLDAIIDGIKDGSLRDPDYSAVENKINEAKGNDNLNKDTQDKIKDIEEELQKIKGKTEPEANAKDDQPAVDELERQLDEILKDIADNSAKAPDYTNWDVAEETFNDFTAEELQNVKTEILDEVAALKNTINTLKADPTANAKDDQKTVNDATTRLNQIIEGINNGSLLNPDDGECKHTSTEYVVDNSNGDKLSTHSVKCKACGEILSTEACTFTTKTVEATCHSEGYTLYSCTVCSYGFRADFTELLPHTYSNWQLVEISCTEVATMTRECIVEGCLAQESKPAEDENGKPVYGMHTLVVVEGKAATCLNDGYTDYTYCVVCNKRTDSTVLPATGHKDDNHNGNCDLCSSPMNPTGHCSCFCHGDSFFEKLLFRIINFFWKLFKINRNCDCGANHW